MSLAPTVVSSEGTGSRRRGPWVIAGMVVTVIAIAAAGLVVWQWMGRPSEQRETQQQSYSIPAGKIVIDATHGEGDIVVLPGNASEVTVEQQVVWDRKKPAVEQTWADGTLRITVDCPEDRPSYDYTCEVTHTIRVPADAQVQLSSFVGNIKIKDIHGDLRVDSETGDLDVTAAEGALAIRVGTGNVTLTELGVREADLTVGTGDLRGTFVQAPQKVTATVETGNLDLDVPNSESYRIEAVAETGDKTIDLQQQPGAPRVIVAEVDTGDLRLR